MSYQHVRRVYDGGCVCVCVCVRPKTKIKTILKPLLMATTKTTRVLRCSVRERFLISIDFVLLLKIRSFVAAFGVFRSLAAGVSLKGVCLLHIHTTYVCMWKISYDVRARVCVCLIFFIGIYTYFVLHFVIKDKLHIISSQVVWLFGSILYVDSENCF